MATEPVVKPQTWADNGKAVIASVVNWMLVECVASKTRWNSLTDGDTLVSRGMELAHEMMVHRGIIPGTSTLTPGELLGAMQDTAKSSAAPGHPLPMTPEPIAPVAPVTTAGVAPGYPGTVSSGGVAEPLTDYQRANLTEAEWNGLTDEDRANRRAAFAPYDGGSGTREMTNAERANALTDEQRAESRRTHP